MAQTISKKRRELSRKAVLLWALIALVLSAITNGYHYSLEGAKGLYVWHPLIILKILLYMGLGPITVAILSLPLEKLANKWPNIVLRWISFIGSLLVSIVSIALLAFLIAVPRMSSLEPARLKLIDPSKGIFVQESYVAPSFSKPRNDGANSADSTIFLESGGSADSAISSDSMLLASVDGPILRLSFSSDPHWGAETANASARASILQELANRRPDAFFLLGDTVETGNSSTQWNFALSDLEALSPDISLRPIMGNHDTLFGGQYLYKKAFWPKDFKSDSGSPYYWSINSGPATIVALDLPWGTEMFGSRQKAWLEKTLADADPQKALIVISHSYFYASGYKDPDFGTPWYDHYQNIPALVPLFEKYGVDLVVSGHNHYQELLSHNSDLCNRWIYGRDSGSRTKLSIALLSMDRSRGLWLARCRGFPRPIDAHLPQRNRPREAEHDDSILIQRYLILSKQIVDLELNP